MFIFYTVFREGGYVLNWHERINEAFDYIEDHLDSNIDLDKIANIMCQSTVNFQRTFSIFMNMSIYDYIRRRRMTLAAIELQTNSIKVIDLALKHGYESPESFTRAFKEIHGITPSAARKKDVALNLFPRITFLLTVKGDIEMDYNNDQTINLKGHNWGNIDPSSQLKPFDTCIYLATKWRESGYVDLLDLGTGLGRHAIYFSKQGFNVTAMDISDYAIQYLKTWAAKENQIINAGVGDMTCMNYSNESFDCILAYHVISHTDSIGIKKTISEIERVLKPNGEVYLSFCSKESIEFIENRSNKFDKNTIVCRDGLEKGIPHFFADINDIKELLVNFKIELIKHTEYFYGDLKPISNQRQKFYYVNAILK